MTNKNIACDIIIPLETLMKSNQIYKNESRHERERERVRGNGRKRGEVVHEFIRDKFQVVGQHGRNGNLFLLYRFGRREVSVRQEISTWLTREGQFCGESRNSDTPISEVHVLSRVCTCVHVTVTSSSSSSSDRSRRSRATVKWHTNYKRASRVQKEG